MPATNKRQQKHGNGLRRFTSYRYSCKLCQYCLAERLKNPGMHKVYEKQTQLQ